MTTATAAESARTAGRPLAGWLCAAWTALGVALLLDPGEIFLMRRRHLRHLRLWRHR